MQAFNYASYARVFALGVSKPNMTKIAKTLFEPIISANCVFNRVGNLHTIDSKNAKAWYDQTADIPENIKTAAGRQDIADHIGGSGGEGGAVIEKRVEDLYKQLMAAIQEKNQKKAERRPGFL